MVAAVVIPDGELVRQEYVDFRVELRQILSERGVMSNPGWGNEEIIDALREAVKGKALDEGERFKHGQCCSFADEYTQLRGAVVETIGMKRDAAEVRIDMPSLDLLSELRRSLGLKESVILLRGVNAPNTSPREIPS